MSATTRHRLREKTFLHTHGFPVAPFRAVQSLDDLRSAVEQLKTPCILKTATFGYDGKGQTRIDDPSHASGDRRLVGPLSRAAAAVGADGIIVEVAEDPEAALCDGPQQLYASDFPEFAADVAAHARLAGRSLA